MKLFCEEHNYEFVVLVSRKYIQRNKKISYELISRWKESFDKTN